MRSSSSSSSSRARPSFPLLVLFVALVFPSTLSLAHLGPRRLSVDHSNSNPRRAFHNEQGAFSPRPTPEPRADLLTHLMATYDSKKLPTLSVKRAEADCYGSSTTAAEINNYFATKKASAGVLQLCPGSVLSISRTIIFTASNQGIQTRGGSSVPLANRATLNLVNASITTIVQAACAQCSDLLLDSLIIDGGQVALGSVTKGGSALLELGGSSQRHTVTNCAISNPRGWSSLHISEGNKNSCVGAVIKNNVIGPSGLSYDVGRAADGISLSCRGSTVQGNTIFDATDGGIVIFGSPGSDISGNTITSVERILLGGINMVDYGPWSGDYTGVLVHHNTITASGAQMKIGIAQGLAIWTTQKPINFGAKVYSNSFGGAFGTFGMGIAGVKDWTVTDNTVSSSARFRGSRNTGAGTASGTCYGLGSTVTPTFAIYDPGKTDSTLNLGDDANCWIQGTIQYLICYIADTTTTPGASPNPAFVSGGTCSAAAPPQFGTSDWKSSGCIQDSTVRVLVGEAKGTSTNTVASCTAFCGSLQYLYSGVENGIQCFCSNTIAEGSTYGYPRSLTTCNTPCPGNSSETCGGGNYGLHLYYDASRVAAPVFPSPSSSTSSRASTSVSSSRSSSTASKTSTISSQSSTKSSASASPSASALPPPTGYTSLGCVKDSSPYVLQGYSFASSSMTIDLCISTCRSNSFAYAGLEYGRECRCGNSLITSGGGGASVACSGEMACSGDSSSKCGGYYLMSLYSSQASLSSVSASTSSSPTVYTEAPSGWSASRCVTDGANGNRLLNSFSFRSDSMTNGLCQTTCRSKSYKYAATEYSSECYCSNTLATSSTVGKDSTLCSYKCSGDANQICGGNWAASLSTFS